jgi:hypothetical protein
MDTLERINAQLAAVNLALMQEDDLSYSIWEIERGAVAIHGTHYDAYKRRHRRRYATLVAALCELPR